MITSAIINFFIYLFNGILSVLPSINLEIPENITETICDFFGVVGYFLPLGALMPILVCSAGILGFRFIWAIILRIKSFIPTMGD